MTNRFQSDTDDTPKLNKTVPLIELRNCTMEFPGVRALDNVNFTLMPGECHGLVGENGAGKSTLSKCITGEYRMTKGELFVEGQKNQALQLFHKRISKPWHSNSAPRISADE